MGVLETLIITTAIAFGMGVIYLLNWLDKSI